MSNYPGYIPAPEPKSSYTWVWLLGLILVMVSIMALGVWISVLTEPDVGYGNVTNASEVLRWSM